MKTHEIALLIILGYNVVAAQSFWPNYQDQSLPYLYDDSKLYSFLPDASRLYDFGMVGTPLFRPDEKYIAEERNTNGFQNSPVDGNFMNYLLYRQRFVC